MKIKRRIKNLLKSVFIHHTIQTVQINSLPKNEWLKGRCALITGGTSGIGFSIAQAFLSSGAAIIITGRSQERINNAIDKLRKKYPDTKIFGLILDNSNVSSFEPSFIQILQKINNENISYIDILVNNAGVNFRGMPNVVEEEYDQVLNTNLKGAFFLSQLFGKYMVENKIKGNILNIASASSLRPADSAYTISKWGLRGLTLGLAKALAKDGITVNGIAPGPTATPMMIKDNTNDMSLDRIPLGRYIMPEEIANMAVILVSDMGKSILGDIIYMTGGAGNLTFDDVSYSFK